MAINKKLIHFKKKENFDNEVANGNILDTSIVFVLDSKEMNTHGTVYKSVNWGVLEPVLITFTAEDIEFQAEEGMTWKEFIDSPYSDGTFALSSTEVVLRKGITLFLNGTDTVNGSKIIIDGEKYMTDER